MDIHRAYIKKLWSLHTTTTNPIKGEDHVTRALCLGKNEVLHQLGIGKQSHAPRRPLGEMRVLIWLSGHLASTSCTCYMCRHCHRTSELSSSLRSAYNLLILPRTLAWRQTVPPPCVRTSTRVHRQDSVAPCRKDPPLPTRKDARRSISEPPLASVCSRNDAPIRENSAHIAIV
jgi:hypothetical protein